jgi:hypothetical protein
MMRHICCTAAPVLCAFLSISSNALSVAANQNDREAERMSAPVVYKDLMLILSDQEGTAIVIFKDAWNKDDKDSYNSGVHYEFRYLAHGAKAERQGKGFVQEKCRWKPAKDDPKKRIAVDVEDRRFIEAGSIQLEWSRADDHQGWVYYLPEKLRVQIGHAEQFRTVNLKRFEKR